MFGNFFKKQESPAAARASAETATPRPESIPVPNSLDMAQDHFAKVIGNYPETSDEASHLLLKEFGTIDRNKIDAMLLDPANKEKVRTYGTLNQNKIDAIEAGKNPAAGLSDAREAA